MSADTTFGERQPESNLRCVCPGGWYCFNKQTCDRRYERMRSLMSSTDWPQTRTGSKTNLDGNLSRFRNSRFKFQKSSCLIKLALHKYIRSLSISIFGPFGRFRYLYTISKNTIATIACFKVLMLLHIDLLHRFQKCCCKLYKILL